MVPRLTHVIPPICAHAHSYEELADFVRIVHEGSRGRVSHFLIHARRAILNEKLSPEQNRNVPPLQCEPRSPPFCVDEWY
jgi:hypothetical protein